MTNPTTPYRPFDRTVFEHILSLVYRMPTNALAKALKRFFWKLDVATWEEFGRVSPERWIAALANETSGPLSSQRSREILDRIWSLASVGEDLVPGMTLEDIIAVWRAWCEAPPPCDAAAGGQGADSGSSDSDTASGWQSPDSASTESDDALSHSD